MPEINLNSLKTKKKATKQYRPYDFPEPLIEGAPNEKNNKETIREHVKNGVNDASIIREQLGNNKETIREHVKNGVNDASIIREQLGNNKGTIREQLGNTLGNNKGTIREQKKEDINDANLIREPIREQDPMKKGAIREQLGNDKGTNFYISVLSGNESKLVRFLFNECLKRGDRTSKITLMETRKILKITSKDVLKTTISRLVKKKIIKRKGGKRGNGGFALYEFPEDIFRQLFLANIQLGNNKGTIREQLGNNKGTDKGTDKGTSLSSSSSIIKFINTTTTTGQEQSTETVGKGEEDDKPTYLIRIPKVLFEVGFNKQHIQQVKLKWPEHLKNLQRSLEALAHDLTDMGIENFINYKKIGSIIAWFMGSMKLGGYEASRPGFLTDEEKGEREMLAKLEKRKKEKVEREEKISKLLFEEWLDTKTKEELITLAKPLDHFMDPVHMARLEQYYAENEMDKFREQFQRGEIELKDKNQERRHSPPPKPPQKNIKKKRQKNASDVSFRLDLDSKHLSN